jgi:hypothetical protein
MSNVENWGFKQCVMIRRGSYFTSNNALFGFYRNSVVKFDYLTVANKPSPEQRGRLLPLQSAYPCVNK